MGARALSSMRCVSSGATAIRGGVLSARRLDESTASVLCQLSRWLPSHSALLRASSVTTSANVACRAGCSSPQEYASVDARGGVMKPLPPLPPIPANKVGVPGFSHRWLASTASDAMRIYTAIWEPRWHNTPVAEAASASTAAAARNPIATAAQAARCVAYLAGASTSPAIETIAHSSNPVASQRWPAARGAVVFAHGFGSHVHDPSGFEQSLIERLSDNGYRVWGYDKRGHGRTGRASGRFGDIGAGEARMDDLATVIDAARAELEPGTPLFIMGHCMGGSDALAFLSREDHLMQARAIDGLILLAPRCDRGGVFSLPMRFLIKLDGLTHVDVSEVFDRRDMSKDVSRMQLTAEQLMHIFHTCDRDKSGYLDRDEFATALNREMQLNLDQAAIAETFSRVDTSDDGLISVDELVRKLAIFHPEDEFCLKQIPVTNDFIWYDSVMDASKVSVPLLLIHGRNDRVNKFEAARDFVEASASSDRTIKCIDGLRHGVAMDMDAPRVRDEVLDWLAARKPS
eukprot:TRINITY_DN20905_c0_g1_i1.p1 TRINITY_DN20905_c0_g1~~TRINITY_DN20905_c0_g1_i1.p1  ORF type:complete len:517 (+),score=67.72 TRINITY_DN20905_c0_g1_i1:172-1722(+)